MPPVKARVAVMYFMVKIMYTYSTLARSRSKYAAFVQYRILQNFVKNRNSAEMGKFRSSAQNSAFRRKLWSLSIMGWTPNHCTTKTTHILLHLTCVVCVSAVERVVISSVL